MYLPALALGYAVPDGSFDAEVHSVFQSALNLRGNGEPYLLTLVISAEADLPQGIRLDTPKDFSFEGFRVGEPVICKDGILHFERNSLTVQLSGAQRWRCDLPALKFDPEDPAVSAAWSFVWEALNGRQRSSKAEIVAEELLNESPRDGVPDRAGQAIRDLLAAARRYELNSSAIDGLIGLGPGLTPSGDDLLVGYLAGLWCTVGEAGKRTELVTGLGKLVLGLLPKTTDISQTYLYHAAQGQVSRRLTDLAAGICRGDNPERLDEVAEAAMSVGHTSGMDAVSGLLIGLATWVDSGISYL